MRLSDSVKESIYLFIYLLGSRKRKIMEKKDVEIDFDYEEKMIVYFLSAGFALYSLYSYFV